MNLSKRCRSQRLDIKSVKQLVNRFAKFSFNYLLSFLARERGYIVLKKFERFNVLFWDNIDTSNEYLPALDNQERVASSNVRNMVNQRRQNSIKQVP